METELWNQFLGMTSGKSDWWTRIGLYEGFWVWGFWLFWAVMIGACMGSFLNVCVLRIPRHESIAGAPSHCFGCGNPIRWYDNIPVWSYCILRGKCRKCGMHIPPRYLVMEILTGLLYAGIMAKTGWSEQSPAVMLPYVILASLAVITIQIDWKRRIIPDVTTYPCMAAGLLCAALLPGEFARETWQQGLFFSGLGLAGTGIGLSLFAVIGRKIAGQDVFGWGDVKFMMAAGALTGPAGAVFILLAGSLGGTLFGIWAGLGRVRRGRSWRGIRIPLGPFLAGAALLWIFAGEILVKEYFKLLTR